MTAKMVATATIQSGTSDGMIIGMRKPVTKKPSATSSLRICAKRTSTPSPLT